MIPTPTHAETGLPIRLSSEEHPRPILDGAIPERAEVMDEGAEPGPGRISWPLLLVSSYASALTLALVWILWSGRNIPRPSESSEPERAEPRASRPVQAGSTSSSPTLALAEDRLTTLGRPIRLGEIEVIPRAVARQPVVLERLQGTSDDRRESDPVLSLSLQIRNLSRAESFAPLDSALVREPAPGPDQPCLEVVGRRRIPLFSLAPESEWSIVGQDFPTLGPGESADTILVTEPFSMTALSDPLIWRVKLRTGPFQTDVVGVRFHTRDILEPQGNFERPGQSPTP